MTAAPKFLLRVYLATDVAMKLTLIQRPQSVDELKTILRDKFRPRLNGEFTLQYEDPDFDGLLSCLIDIDELPEKGTLRVVRSESDDSSVASSDTDILPHVPLQQRQKHWPSTFTVPSFSLDVEYTIFGFKAYPHQRDLSKAAEALVDAHPCLSERGSETAWYGWKVSLAHKMGNDRTIMSKSGCAEVAVNTGKRSKNSPENEHPHSNIKKPRRSEVNFLPNFPKGENQTSLEQLRQQMIEELEKTERDQLLIGRNMQTTFALRRQEIVTGDKLVKDLLTRWPSLLMESQVFAEFHRITNVNLRNTFYAELDRHTPKLMEQYRQKALRTGKISEALKEIFRKYDLKARDVTSRRTLALRALPVYLKEDDTDFFKCCDQDGEPDVSDCPLALLSSSPDIFEPENIAVIIEGNIVMSELSTLSDAFLLLFGLIYVFNIEYPKKLVNTFTFIQKIMVCLDDNTVLKPCLPALKN